MLVPKTWTVLRDAVEEGCGFALNRVTDSEKSVHDLNDSERFELVEHMAQEVLNAISERFDFVHAPAEAYEGLLTGMREMQGALDGLARCMRERRGMGDNRELLAPGIRGELSVPEGYRCKCGCEGDNR